MASVRKRKWTHNGAEKEAWVVSYTDVHGKRRLKTFTDKASAEKGKKTVERDLKFGRTPFTSGSVITVRQAAEFYLRREEIRMRDGEINWSTYKRKCLAVDRDISPFIGSVKLENLRPLVVQGWVDDLREVKDEKRSPLAVRHAVVTLRSIIDEAMRMEFVIKNFVKEVPPHLPRISKVSRLVPTLETVKLLLSKADPDTQIGLVVELAIFTGMRIGEICALTWSNVFFDAATIAVRQAVGDDGKIKSPKTVAGIREVPVPPRIVDNLRNWKVNRKALDADLVFSAKQRVRKYSRANRVKNYRDAYHEEWERFQEEAGLAERYTFHSLRHVAASLFVEQRLTLKRLQTIMGHAKVDITLNRYGHVLFDDGSAHRASRNIQIQLEAQS